MLASSLWRVPVESTSLYMAAIAYLLAGFAVAETFERAERKRGKDLGTGYIVFFILWPITLIVAVIVAFNRPK